MVFSWRSSRFSNADPALFLACPPPAPRRLAAPVERRATTVCTGLRDGRHPTRFRQTPGAADLRVRRRHRTFELAQFPADRVTRLLGLATTLRALGSTQLIGPRVHLPSTTRNAPRRLGLGELLPDRVAEHHPTLDVPVPTPPS